jgi:DNA-binding transcriptional ArsR family regulator
MTNRPTSGDELADNRPKFIHIYHHDLDEVLATCGVYGLAVYALLTKHADSQFRTCYPAIPSIARAIGASQPTVRKTLAALAEHGFLEITQRSKGGRSATHLYRIRSKTLNHVSGNAPKTLNHVEGKNPETRNVVSENPKRRLPELEPIELYTRELRSLDAGASEVPESPSVPSTESGTKANPSYYPHFAAMLEELGQNPKDFPKAFAAKQIAVLRRTGLSVDDVRGCTRWLRSWREQPVDAFVVEEWFGRWMLDGRPETGRRRGRLPAGLRKQRRMPDGTLIGGTL